MTDDVGRIVRYNLLKAFKVSLKSPISDVTLALMFLEM